MLAKTDVGASTGQAWVNTLWSMLHAFVVTFNFVAITKVAQEMEVRMHLLSGPISHPLTTFIFLVGCVPHSCALCCAAP